MTKKQIKIHEGLGLIGPQLSAFYNDGLILINSDLVSKSYLIGHCAREIDGGIRDIFSTKMKKLECELCGAKKHTETHLESICKLLKVKKTSEFATKWFKIASKFPKYAHRNGVTKPPRIIDEFKIIWEQYEEILFEIVGKFFSFRKILSIKINNGPDYLFLKSLPNTFKNQALKSHFFENSISINWFNILFDNDFLNPNSLDFEWIEMSYLFEISDLLKITKDKISEKKICQFVDLGSSAIQKNTLENKFEYGIFRLIQNIDVVYITSSHIEFILSFIKKNSHYVDEILKDLIPKLLNSEKEDLVFQLLEELIKPKLYSQTEYVDPFSDDQTIPADFVPKSDYISILSLEYDFYEFEKLIKKIILKYEQRFYQFLKNSILDIPKLDQDYLLSTVNVPDIKIIKSDAVFQQDNCTFRIIAFSLHKCLNDSTLDSSVEILSLLASDLPLFKRLAFQIIADNFSKYNEIFHKIDFNYFNDDELRFEVSQIIENNACLWDNHQIELLIGKIEQYQRSYIAENDSYSTEENEKHRCRKVLELLKLLQANNSEKLAKTIIEYETKSDFKLAELQQNFRNGSYLNWSTGYEIPESSIGFESKTISEVVEYFKNFSEVDKYGRSLLIGAYSSLYDDIMQFPQKYSKNLSFFCDLDNEGFKTILRVFPKSVNLDNKLNFSVDSTLEFIESWMRNHKKSEPEPHFEILTYLKDININKEILLNSSELNRIKSTLMLISKNTKPQNNDEVLHRGGIVDTNYKLLIDALILYSLNECKLRKAKKISKWDPTVKIYIETELKKNPNTDLLSALGLYYPNIEYLSKGWMKENIDLLLPKDEVLWLASMNSIIGFSKSTYETYALLFQRGEIIKLINYYNKVDSHNGIIQKCIDITCWFSVTVSPPKFKLQKYSQDVLKYIIELKNEYFYDNVIRNFIKRWTDEGNTLTTKDSYFKKVIFEIYNKIIGELDSLNLDHRFLLSISLFSSLDEMSSSLFKEVIIRCNSTIYDKTFFKYLNLLLEVSENEVIDIMITISKISGEYPNQINGQSFIIQIVEKIYVLNKNEIADEICNNYGTNRYDFLVPLYEKYNTF